MRKFFLGGRFTGSGPEMKTNWHVDNHFLTLSTRWSYQFDDDIFQGVVSRPLACQKSAQVLYEKYSAQLLSRKGSGTFSPNVTSFYITG